MSNKINARSPYFIEAQHDDLSYVIMNLYIWDGSSSPLPSEASYSFTKTKASNGTHIVFEIADYIRDYIETEYGDYATNAVWVYWSYQMYDADDFTIGGTVTGQRIAVDGYGYFEEGINPRETDSYDVMQDNTDIYYHDGEDVIFSVWSDDVGYAILDSGNPSVYWEDVADYWEVVAGDWQSGDLGSLSIPTSTDSSFKIRYVRITDTDQLSDTETVEIYDRVGPNLLNTITLHKVCEPKYSPMKVIFYNRFGAMQDLWFFKRSDTSINVTSDTFKRNTVDYSTGTATYNTAKHQIKSFNLNGKESVVLNTDFLPEDFNEVIEQLLLSEEVWIDNGANVLPVRPVTNSLTFKKGVNEKLISYTINFEYAFDKINNIR